MYTSVPTSVPNYATIDSLEPTQPAHAQRSPLKSTYPQSASLILYIEHSEAALSNTSIHTNT